MLRTSLSLSLSLSMSLALAGAITAACGGASPPPAAPPVAPRDTRTCAHVADHLMSLMSDQARKAPMETQDAIRRAFRERCEQDAWSAAVRDCFLQLADLKGGEACARQMTEAQVQAMDQAL